MAEVFIETEDLLDRTKYILTIKKKDSARYIHVEDRTAHLLMYALEGELLDKPPRINFALEVARAMRVFLDNQDIAEDSSGDLVRFVEWVQNYEPTVG